MKGHTALLSLVSALALASPAMANDGCEGTHAAGTAKLNVQVHSVRSSAGEVAITVYADDKRKFLARGGKLMRLRVKAAPTVHVCFWLPPANYEVAVYHDADGDQDFDRNLLGFPTEGFGFSNDPETKVGLPPISQVRFKVAAPETSISVRMKYLRQAKQ